MTEKQRNLLNYFSRGEKLLWCTSIILIILSFVLFDRGSCLTLSASLIGVTSLIFNAKGNPLGPLLMVFFSILYGIISYTFSYYGEMATYLGMTAPMSVFALAAWLKNPYNGKRTEVEIHALKGRELVLMTLLALIVTLIFYYILRAFHTANLLPSTISVTTSFLAVYQTYKRSPYFALAYASNDIILIVLWSLAAFADISYLSVAICFSIFLINDTYTFINWTRMHRRQQMHKLGG